MDYSKDKRVVLTLDAGGTNFVFSALKGYEEIIEPIKMKSNGNNLKKCLSNIVSGFSQMKDSLKGEKIVAISFAFPGPADYPNGIIGDLGNLPGFRGGVALGPMLQDAFKMPVFINNDGNLYAYGESIAGFLPEINKKLKQSGSTKKFRNIVGITLGTGFGAGLISDGNMIIGDNSNAGEVWLLSSRHQPKRNAEEGVSIRAVQRLYAELSGRPADIMLSPETIYKIGKGLTPGDKYAAIKSFEAMGKMLGDSLSNLATLFDGLIVIGGGISGARDLFMPAVMKEMRSKYRNQKGEEYPRLAQKVFNLENENDVKAFVAGDAKKVEVPVSGRELTYDSMQRIGIGFSKIGTSKAISIGAYVYALKNL
ncbi:MAG: hypothetical protein A2W91_17485 [Bacteroidetes bacterium GWF2_38_335]|nr:MAG: hypothetical protein A2W91_17485 [Bacteroidetes bacterium GWF2_38_335]OFY78072.1 MAG: hypothetical protein A2281_18970 [Bacteroidetes bacterium RIFOXYA12_FULL_38_20]HBS88346.1 hypothetical protein [Bacteroidales bacterium]